MPIRDVFAHTEELAATIENVDVDGLRAELDGDDDVLLLDIREIQELVDSGTIPGSTHVPRGMLEFWADPASPYARDYFDEHRRTIVFCAGGGRSVYATIALAEMGFTNVANFAGGYRSWTEAGGEVDDYAARSRWVRRER